MIIRPKIEVRPTDLQVMIKIGYRHGWKRTDPTKRWTEKEEREVVGWVIQRFVSGEIRQ